LIELWIQDINAGPENAGNADIANNAEN